MTWSYDNTDLTTTTDAGRLNAVRLLVGDTDTNDQLLQNEEVVFGLSENNNRVYYTAAWCADVLSSKYSAQVDIQLDETLEAKYSQLSKQWSTKARTLRDLAKKVDGASLGIKAGGITKVIVETVRDDTTRVRPAFFQNQFSNPPDWPNEDYTE